MNNIDLEDRVRSLAVVSAMKKLLADAEEKLKADVATLKRGTVYAYDGDNELGYAYVPKVSEPKPKVVDEDQAVAWAVENFGESHMRIGLSEIGRKDVIAAAERGVDVPGVEIPAPRASSPTFRPARNVVALVDDMVRGGRVDLTSVLPSLFPQIEGAQ